MEPQLFMLLLAPRRLEFEGFILVANPNYGDYIAEPIPFVVSGIMIPRVDDAKVILKYYEEQTKRDRKGTTTEFGAMVAVGEGRVASFTRRSPIVSRFSSTGPDIIGMHNNLAYELKPNILAPRHQIWAAWTPISALEPIVKGHDFALLSGTSMSKPHVDGIAALIKQYNPLWTPAMITSAISTTSSKYDNLEEHMMAESFEASSLLPSTPFEYGAGFVSPNCSIDPVVKLDGTGQLKNILVTATSGGVGHYIDQLAKLILCFRGPEYKVHVLPCNMLDSLSLSLYSFTHA
ncbi:Subtilisin-like protease SBT2.4 [Glycine soja]